ncbi:MAG TPA: hypothetical protein PLL76_10680 [Thermoanaerobaculia bacterium]|mgnify:CR=1 FL=1|nr:hypothetical protein [Thermoanaerobaculia bacterium]
MRNVYLALSEGNVYRDLIRLGMLRHLLETVPDVRVILLTQAWAVREVLEEVGHDRVIVARHDWYKPGRLQGRIIQARRRLRRRCLIDSALRIEASMTPAPDGVRGLFEKYPPNLVVSTQPLEVWESDLVSYARKHGVPSLGIIKSWDNVLRRPQARADKIAVWGRANHREALEIERYREDEVKEVGACAFDRYFEADAIRPREELWKAKGLDPSRPIILFGTAGAFSGDWDETFMMDLLLEMTAQSEDLKDVQFVCRLHPCSRLQYFWPYRDNPRVVLSFGSYVKTLGWCMTRAEVDDMASMLCHADLVVTPASTLSIEAPIFDTPTIATLFSTVRPDLHARATEAGWLRMHFAPIVQNDWLPLAWNPEDLLAMIRKGLADRSWYRAARRTLVEEYVSFTDGKSYRRVANLIDELSRGAAGSRRGSSPRRGSREPVGERQSELRRDAGSGAWVEATRGEFEEVHLHPSDGSRCAVP